MSNPQISMVKDAARGRWPELLATLGGISPELLDGKHHPCPLCGGTDRFRLIDRDAGALYCNACFNRENGDGLAALCWLTHCGLSTVVHRLADHLNVKLPEARNGKQKGGGKIVATYDYQDETGNLLFQVCRLDPKDFRQRRPKEGCGWEWRVKGTRRVVYRVPELNAADKSVITFVPEGEKDVDRLGTAKFVATCNVGGAGKWRKSDSEPLKGRPVVILPDNDTAGQNHASRVADSLRGIASSIKVLALPGLPEKGDVSDWLDAGGTPEELLRLATEAPEWTPLPKKQPRDGYNLTDLGNGERLARLHGRDLRYCWPWAKWLVWDGQRWRIDDTGGVASRAKATVRNIYTEAAQCTDDDERKALGEWARASERRERISAMIDLTRSEDGIPVLPQALDCDPWLFNCPNGTLDLRAGELREHSQHDYITKLCPTEYRPDATCPTWEACLDRLFAGDTEIIGFLQRLFGYCLSGSTEIHVLPICWGVGSNGKSTVIGAAMDVMGPDYSMKAPHQMLMTRRGEHHPTELADLFGKRLVASVETAVDGRLNEALVKDLTGGDRQRARRMREDHWEFTPTHKLILATNHRPEIQDSTHSTWRRVKLVPFQVVIPDGEQDHALPGKLKAEAPGILAWMVEGCKAWLQGGLAEPEAVRVATSEYRAAEDHMSGFLQECCTEQVGATVRSRTLFDCYKRYCEETGEQPTSQRKFGQALTERGFDRFTSNGTWYKGVDLKDDCEQPDGWV